MDDAPHVAILRSGLARACDLRDDLERELAAIGESTSSVPDDEHDAEGSTVGYERARVTALLAVTRREIDDLRAALDRACRTTDGENTLYGRCDRCGGPIGVDRLAALPAAAVCVACSARRPDGGLRTLG